MFLQIILLRRERQENHYRDLYKVAFKALLQNDVSIHPKMSIFHS